MSSLFHVDWTVRACETVFVKRPCGRCNTLRPFCSTGKFRLNANGARLDAWLIYRCTTCGKRWNRALYERRPVASLSKDLITALQGNDADLANRVVREFSQKKRAETSGETGTFHLEKRIRSDPGAGCFSGNGIAIAIGNPDGCRVRLDLVLARGLALSRKDVIGLAGAGVLRIPQASLKAFRRRLPADIIVECNSAGSRDAGDLVRRAIALPGSDE